MEKKLLGKQGNEKLLRKFGGVYDGTKFYIYRILDITNKKKYFGKTDNPYIRWNAHQNAALRMDDDAYYLHRAMNKRGVDHFKFSVIEVVDNAKEAYRREKYWISRFKTNVCRYGDKFGYNLTDGGEGISGYKLSVETKQRLSEYAKSINRRPSQKCIDNGRLARAKLSETDVIHIKILMETTTLSNRKLALQFNVGRKTISDIRLGKTWAHIPFPSGVKKIV
ncbi:MAG: GIY-YIG nuclease family protein, partial [Patescibacteria group bacterium]|nr:GIY-YIG nuclease family protein [Patescibacteria group bacterium]